MTSPDDKSGQEPTSFDEQLLYPVIREAVEDAILGVLGTILLLGIGILFIWFGVMLLAFSFRGIPQLVFGIFAIVAGIYLAASSVKIIPPIREWF